MCLLVSTNHRLFFKKRALWFNNSSTALLTQKNTSSHFHSWWLAFRAVCKKLLSFTMGLAFSWKRARKTFYAKKQVSRVWICLIIFQNYVRRKFSRFAPCLFQFEIFACEMELEKSTVFVLQNLKDMPDKTFLAFARCHKTWGVILLTRWLSKFNLYAKKSGFILLILF